MPVWARVWSSLLSLWQHHRRLVLALLLVVGAALLWRGIAGGRALPAEVLDAIRQSYVVCISMEETPIWPGEPRMPECGRVEVTVVGEGVVPDTARASGVTRAVCYRVVSENPYWRTLGETRHEVRWYGRIASKVAVLLNGEWQIFPDQGNLDEQRWADYSCPGPYESGPTTHS